MGRWAIGLLVALSLLVAAVLGMTTRSLGMDLVAQREINDLLQRRMEERDQALAALDRDVQRLRNLVDTLQLRQAPDVAAVQVEPPAGDDGVVVADAVRLRVTAGAGTTHVLLLFQPGGTAGDAADRAGLPHDPGSPGEGVPPSPAYVVAVDRSAADGWTLQWRLPTAVAGSLYVQACNGPRCSFFSGPPVLVRHPQAPATD